MSAATECSSSPKEAFTAIVPPDAAAVAAPRASAAADDSAKTLQQIEIHQQETSDTAVADAAKDAVDIAPEEPRYDYPIRGTPAYLAVSGVTWGEGYVGDEHHFNLSVPLKASQKTPALKPEKSSSAEEEEEEEGHDVQRKKDRQKSAAARRWRGGERRSVSMFLSHSWSHSGSQKTDTLKLIVNFKAGGCVQVECKLTHSLKVPGCNP
jgi:hypothetical protein